MASRWGKPNMVTLLLDNKASIDERTRVNIVHFVTLVKDPTDYGMSKFTCEQMDQKTNKI